MWLRDLLTVTLTSLAAPCQLSSQRAVDVRGFIHTIGGPGVADANVFLLGSLAGATSDSAGRFHITGTAEGASTLVVRRIGFVEWRRVLVASDSVVDVTLSPQAAPLAAVTTQAGRYSGGDERNAVLSPIDVVTIPGAAADIGRAISSLPGVQARDEGNALFVRGGDYTETKTYVNGVAVLGVPAVQSPAELFTGSIDPFLIDAITFSSGGFGARDGNALSGIVSLRTLGVPTTSGATIDGGMGSISGGAALALPAGVGLRAAYDRFDAGTLFRVNGVTRTYDPAPRQNDGSASAGWQYRATGQIKVFSIAQSNLIGVGVDAASFAGVYRDDLHSGVTTVDWSDVFGPAHITAVIGESRFSDLESFGDYQLHTNERSRQGRASIEWTVTGGTAASFGVEGEGLRSTLVGSIPASADDRRPGAPEIVFQSPVASDRTGAFVEADHRAGDDVRVVAGIRADRSTLTGKIDVDPRLSMSWHVLDPLTLTAAAGVYHQLPDQSQLDSLAVGGVASMCATQMIAGAQLGGGPMTVRLEVYDKRYSSLAQISRDDTYVFGGRGESRGVDLLGTAEIPGGARVRLAYSYIWSRRTDPTTGQMARSPFEIPHTAMLTVDRMWHASLQTGAAVRAASGRPFTPVEGAAYDMHQGTYSPIYGDPFSERLPATLRVDLSCAYLFAPFAATRGVVYASLSNAFNRFNTFSYQYAANYSSRTPVRSLFNRTLYVGASLSNL